MKMRYWGHRLSKEETTEANCLWERIVRLKDIAGLTGVDIIMTWVKRRVHPCKPGHTQCGCTPASRTQPGIGQTCSLPRR